MASGLNQAMRGERDGKKKRREERAKGREGQAQREEPRERLAEMAVLHRNQKLGDGRGLGFSWRGLGLGGGRTRRSERSLRSRVFPRSACALVH